MCSFADVTGCVPVPVTLIRRNVSLRGLASAVRTVLAPALVVGLAEFTKASAVIVAVGAAGGQACGGPPTHTPPAHASAVVQALPSLQGSVFGVPPAHAPAPLQVVPLMQGLLAQAWPAASNWQSGEQQSPATRLPSSHCSPRSTTPFPQICSGLPMRTVNWFVCCPPGGKPGPSIRKMFVPQGLPATVWFAPGLPTSPGGGAGATAVRNGATRPAVIDCVNARFTPADAGMRGLSWVKFTVPRVSAWST